MTSTMVDGTYEINDRGYALHFTRQLPKPVERVWSALTEPEQLRKWLAEASIDLVEGGSVHLRWLNVDPGNNAVALGTITQLDPPRLLEMDTDIHGLIRWTLTPEGDGCRLALDVQANLPDEFLTEVLAGWHVHLDFLEEALAGGEVDWPNWPRDRWQAHHDHYEARYR